MPMRLAWFNQGKEFEPKIDLPDIIDYEDREEKAIVGRASGLILLRKEFVEKILSRSADGDQAIDLKDVAEIQRAFWELWDYPFRARAARPAPPSR